MSRTLEVDVAVIGAGTAGLGAFRAARQHTDEVVLIEGGAYGTTCARVGCMPSKLLIAAADAAHAAAGAWRFGADVRRQPEVDGRAVMARVRSERDRFAGFVVRGTEAHPHARRRRGGARVAGDHTLHVGDDTVRARATVIATGSRPRIFPFLADLGDRLVVNDEVFSWETLPRSVAVVGPGVIGLELGQALARLGVRTVLLGRGGFVGPLSDPAVRDAAARAIGAEVPLYPDADATYTRTDDGVRVQWTADGASHDEVFEYVLAAVGRTPNTDRIGLEHTTAPRDARGRPVFDPFTMQLGDSPLFLAGDANDDRPLLHEASDEGRIAGANAARFPDVTPGMRRTPLGVVFSEPNLAMVGARYADLDPAQIVVGEVSFDDQGRSRVMGVNRGRLHVYADKATGRLLGAELAAPRGEHLAHLLAWQVQQGATIADLLRMPFYHPVIEEGLRTALRDAAAKLDA